MDAHNYNDTKRTTACQFLSMRNKSNEWTLRRLKFACASADQASAVCDQTRVYSNVCYEDAYNNWMDGDRLVQSSLGGRWAEPKHPVASWQGAQHISSRRRRTAAVSGGKWTESIAVMWHRVG